MVVLGSIGAVTALAWFYLFHMAAGTAGVADMTRLRWAVIRTSMKLGILGLGIGLAGALATERFIEAVLFDTPGLDPVTLVGLGLILLATTVAAAYAPARRATQVHPRTALTTD